jgi:parallel beta-helix repeat protein
VKEEDTQKLGSVQKPVSRRNLLLSLGAAGAAIALGGVIKPEAAQAASNQVIVNVKDFGAKGNTRFDEDDSPHIQSAIDSAALTGGIVYIPKGFYFLRSSLRLGSNVTIVGAGIDATILKSNSSNISLVTGYGTTRASVQGISFQGSGSFSAYDTPNVEYGVSLASATEVHVLNCSFKLIANGIKSTNSQSIVIEDCVFDNIVGHSESLYQGFGVISSGGADHFISKNHFLHQYKPSITLNGGNRRSVIMHNRMENCYHIGIDVSAELDKEESQQHIISGNIMEYINNPTGKTGFGGGIRLTGNCYLNIIADNIMSNLDDFGIELLGKADQETKRPRNNRVEGNIIKSVKKMGISLINTYDNTVTSNDIQYSGTDGIIINTSGKGSGATSKNNRITGNHIIHAGTAAVRIAGVGCRNTILFGNVGNGNKEGIVNKGTNTTTTSL